MEKHELEAKSIDELRKIARSQPWAPGRSTTIQGLNKAQLVASILSGNIVFAPGLTEEPAPAAAPAAAVNVDPNDPAALLAAILQNHLKTPQPTIDQDTIKGMITAHLDALKAELKEELKAAAPAPLQIKVILPDGTTKDLGHTHAIFETVRNRVANKINVMLVGPSGSGKTHLCKQIADSLQLPFYPFSCGTQTTKGDLIGYGTATGGAYRSALYMAYKFGGLFLLDEIDAGNSNVLITINNITSNGTALFPGENGWETVEKHENFRIIAAANTFGLGADILYVGRCVMDAATRNRFASIVMDYDETLEDALTPNKEWLRRVRSIRQAVFTLKEKVVVSPRSSMTGSTLLALGENRDAVEDAVIFQGVNPEVKRRILANAR